MLFIVLVSLTAGCEPKASPTYNAQKYDRSNEPAPTETYSERQRAELTKYASVYKAWHKMTDRAYSVPPQEARFCEPQLQRIPRGPHEDNKILVYMNDLAKNSYESDTGYPVGSIIVKEKLSQSDSEAEAGVNGMLVDLGGMLKKAEGWQYFYIEKGRLVELANLSNCAKCHKRAEKFDFVFGTWGKRDSFGIHGY